MAGDCSIAVSTEILLGAMELPVLDESAGEHWWITTEDADSTKIVPKVCRKYFAICTWDLAEITWE